MVEGWARGAGRRRDRPPDRGRRARAAPPEGLLGSDRASAADRVRPDPPAGRCDPGEELAPIPSIPNGPALRPATNAPALPPDRRRAVSPGVEAPADSSSAARAGAGRVRVDGAVQPPADGVRARRLEGRAAGGGVLLRDPPHSDHAGALCPRP